MRPGVSWGVLGYPWVSWDILGCPGVIRPTQMLIIEQLPNIHGIIKIFHLNVDFALKIRKIRHQHVFSYKAKIPLTHSCLQVTIRTSIEE